MGKGIDEKEENLIVLKRSLLKEICCGRNRLRKYCSGK